MLVGGLAIWLLDRNEYEHLTDAFWLILQTVTSVGYGDVTPVDPVGRTVAAAVMLLGIAFVSILTASITSVFLDARQQEQRNLENAVEAAHRDRLEARLDDLLERLERIERQGQPPP